MSRIAGTCTTSRETGMLRRGRPWRGRPSAARAAPPCTGDPGAGCRRSEVRGRSEEDKLAYTGTPAFRRLEPTVTSVYFSGFSRRSFSAVSRPIFATKAAVLSVFRAPQCSPAMSPDVCQISKLCDHFRRTKRQFANTYEWKQHLGKLNTFGHNFMSSTIILCSLNLPAFQGF